MNLQTIINALLGSTKLFVFCKNHAAYISGAGFAILAAAEYINGDTAGAMKTFMLAMTSFGLKHSIEKVFSGLPDASTPAAVVPPAAPAPKA